MIEKKKIVRVTGVTKDFDLGKIVVKVLKGIDLEIEEGKYISIMGPSGSGKSTLFNMIGGLDKPTSGKVCRTARAMIRGIHSLNHNVKKLSKINAAGYIRINRPIFKRTITHFIAPAK